MIRVWKPAFPTRLTFLIQQSLEAALQPIDDNLLNTPDYVYKKRPLQKRQTKLFKSKCLVTVRISSAINDIIPSEIRRDPINATPHNY